MNQTPPPAPTCQVTLTGRRVEGVDEAEFLQRLQTRFKLPEAQARSMLRGRVTVKRNVDAAYAGQMAQAFVKIGIDAVVEPMAGAPAPAAPVPAPAPAAPASVGFQPPKPEPFASPLPVIRPVQAPAPATADLPALTGEAAMTPIGQLRALAKQRLPQPRLSAAYRLNLLLVTLLSVAIPAFYFALTGGIAYGLYWYLTHIHHYVSTHSPHLLALIYGVPGLVGGVLFLFLVRPLFLRRPRPPQPVKITTETEPEFIQGIQALCRAIGVAPPVEIHASWQVNAWVHYRNGGLSLLSGSKVLTIGLPLVQGLSAREFVGVLAHEFGHFTQRTGMACSWIINTANGWLEHRAYGPDDLEERLRGTVESSEEGGLWPFAAGVALIGIQGIRLMMAGLFKLSFRLSRSMSRQMEFDADRYEALVAGSDGFARTARNLRALSHAHAEVDQANANAWQENHLLRDLPEAVALHFKGYKPDRLTAIEHEMGQVEQRYWDSHPPDLDRVRNAEDQEAPGVYREAAPASSLLRNTRALSEQVTLAYYRELGIRFRVEQLRTRAEVLGLVEDRDQHRERLDEYFNGQLQAWPLLPLQLAAEHPAARLGWQEAIDEIRRRSPEITRAWGHAVAAEERLPRMRLAAELGLTSQQIGLSSPTLRQPDELREERRQVVRQETAYYKILHEVFGYHARRFDCAIASMAATPKAKAEELRRALIALQQLGDSIGGVIEIGEAARMLMHSIQPSSPDPWHNALNAFKNEYAEHALKLIETADGIAQSVTQEKTLGGYLRSRCPTLGDGGNRDPAFVLRATAPLAQAVQHFYRLALGELVTLCAAAEKMREIQPIRLVPRE